MLFLSSGTTHGEGGKHKSKAYSGHSLYEGSPTEARFNTMVSNHPCYFLSNQVYLIKMCIAMLYLQSAGFDSNTFSPAHISTQKTAEHS